jgi:hypothetical protein
VTSVRTRFLLPLACLATAGTVGVATIVDHHLKQRNINDAQVARYFCRVQHTRCGYESWRRIEARWQSRQLAYEIVVIGFGGLGLALLGYRLVRR